MASRWAAGRGIDYAEFSRTGKRKAASKKTKNDSKLEEGQIVDSPLSITPAEDDFEFNTDSATLSTNDNNEDLNYIDDVYAESEGILGDKEEPDNDITREEVWQQKQEKLVQNRGKREKLKLKLERQKQIAATEGSPGAQRSQVSGF